MATLKQQQEMARRKRLGIGWFKKENGLMLHTDQSQSARDARAIDADTRERIKKYTR